ncbi:MAG TPA: alkene reductase [Abditibacteriaceae bacterium]|jgi:2,4-dienoyl-CoA reductase-like NADH-dependent reductase (Old Yellow Enzyme family)
MSKLFSPWKLGDLELPNRVIMAPLTRCRASEGRVPNDLMRRYYEQRASAGLILTEATAVTPQGVGYVDTPGIWSPEQIAGWKNITEAVHARGGRIFCQLWHVGRLSHPDFLDGDTPVAPSAIAAIGDIRVPTGHKPYPTPRALETEEVKALVETYKQGAINAREAGFDGVEIHGANGYLPDQFLRDGSNQRTDEYGGSVENRARFLLEITDAAIEVWGAGRVGVHLSPRDMEHHSIADSNPAAIFTYVARELGKRGIAFIFTRESVDGGERYAPAIKDAFGGAFIANESFTSGQAQQLVQSGEADAVAWGQLFIANPDLPARLQQDAPLNEPNPSTFYAPGELGYTDYPALAI